MHAMIFEAKRGEALLINVADEQAQDSYSMVDMLQFVRVTLDDKIRQNPNKLNRNVKCPCTSSLSYKPGNKPVTTRTKRHTFSEDNFWTQPQSIWSVFVLISQASFLGGIREPRGRNWPFPSHRMLYHFHCSIYHWREMEKGHSVCVFSTNHHHCDYMSLTWMLSQISTLNLPS